MGQAGVTEDYICKGTATSPASSSPVPGGAHTTACVVPGFILPNRLACQLAHIHIQNLPEVLVKKAQVRTGQVEGKQVTSQVKLEAATQRVSGEVTANTLPMGDAVPGSQVPAFS